MAVVDKLSKVSHFILVNTTYSISDVAQVFIREIVRLHGVINKLVSDKDAKLIPKFWNDLFVGLGIEFHSTQLIIDR